MRELSLHILDALENSLEAGATLLELIIEEDLAVDRLTIVIRDNGRGMSQEQLARVFDPFYTTRTTRHIGLGLPLFKAAAERCHGDVTLTSEPGKGTTLQATFQHSHIDRVPLGNIARTLIAVILNQRGELHYVHRVNAKTFDLDTAAIKAELQDVPITTPAVVQWLTELILEEEAELEAP